MLEYIITSRVKRNLLKLILTNPDTEFYVREISRRIEEPVNAVRRELGYLEKAGLVKSRCTGNLKYYSAIKESPIYPELKKIIYTTIAFGDYLAEKFTDVKQIELAFIYGSVGRNEEGQTSDIDLFVVGEIEEDEVHRLVYLIETDIGRTINYTLMSKEEFEKRLNTGDPFVKRVMKEKKIMLKGSHDHC